MQPDHNSYIITAWKKSLRNLVLKKHIRWREADVVLMSYFTFRKNPREVALLAGSRLQLMQHCALGSAYKKPLNNQVYKLIYLLQTFFFFFFLPSVHWLAGTAPADAVFAGTCSFAFNDERVFLWRQVHYTEVLQIFIVCSIFSDLALFIHELRGDRWFLDPSSQCFPGNWVHI